MKNFTPTEERAEVERLARLICRAIGYDPDLLAAPGQPQAIVGGGHVVMTEWAAPIWSRFSGAAKMIFDDQRRQEELAEGATDDL